MKFLFIGDVVGKPGRKCLQRNLKEIRKQYSIDLVIANAENAAGGAGITEKVVKEIKNAGVDIMTGGNHCWDRRDIFKFIDGEPCLVRPLNLPEATTPGKGSVIYELEEKNIKVAVISLIGRVFMSPADCPFQAVDRELERLKSSTNLIIVDIHAEATSEKQALGWHLAGRVSAVMGTHTHVQTADQRLLRQQTAYISDVGMTGLYDSILGIDIEGPLKRFTTRLPHPLNIGDGLTVLNAVVVEVDETTGQAQSIERISEII
jgi:hypothetical protein